MALIGGCKNERQNNKGNMVKMDRINQKLNEALSALVIARDEEMDVVSYKSIKYAVDYLKNAIEIRKQRIDFLNTRKGGKK